MKTSNQCNKEKRIAMKAQGKVEIRLWVYPNLKERVNAYVNKLNKQSKEL